MVKDLPKLCTLHRVQFVTINEYIDLNKTWIICLKLPSTKSIEKKNCIKIIYWLWHHNSLLFHVCCEFCDKLFFPAGKTIKLLNRGMTGWAMIAWLVSDGDIKVIGISCGCQGQWGWAHDVLVTLYCYNVCLPNCSQIKH